MQTYGADYVTPPVFQRNLGQPVTLGLLRIHLENNHYSARS